MKRINVILVLFLAILMLNTSCEDRRYQTYIANVPEYMTYDDLRSAVEVETARSIRKTGKIYFKDQFLLVNEYMEGIHIIDVSDPASPGTLSFINIPGNVDMAIKDDILYADSYTDLVMIDISDLSAPFEMNRIDSILNYTLPPYDTDYPLAEIDPDKGVVTGWEVKEYTQEIQANPYPWPIYYGYEDAAMRSSGISSAMPAGGSAYGIGGSMARFATYDDYLYLLEQSSMLKAFNISDIENPELKYEKYVGWGLETMFIYEGFMYLGASSGMHILSLEEPGMPYKTSEYRHITSCDPVVVSGNRAYVTLRSGNMCGGTADLLEVVDVSDKWSPDRIASYPMTEPYGLGISGTTLFICQGENGLSVYDASDDLHITDHMIASFPDIHAVDVIPADTILFTIGESGFYIYDYSDPEAMTLTGSIPVSGE